MGDRILILDNDRIGKKLQRMAYQIWEHNSHESELHFIGIEGTGTAVARELASRLRAISKLEVVIHTLRMNKKQPLSESIDLAANLNGKSVVLIDDVANSGKTLLYAMKPILAFEPKKILVAVLVDRKHKSFPVSPDIVGHTVATTLQEHIEVVCEGENITSAYLQ
jgi:pyrimidine operon attenuation protein / uracil phosphoribosyltransferase